MKLKISEKVEFPEGQEFNFSGNTIKISKNSKEAKKSFNLKNIVVKKEKNAIILECEKSTKRERKMINTIVAHIKNMINGLEKNYVYKLEIAYLHFPITLEIKKEKGEIIIKNFLGEKKPRVCKILNGAEVKIEKNLITVESHDKEIAGQTAANLEIATKIKKRDRRKFQDGIFITEKNGELI